MILSREIVIFLKRIEEYETAAQLCVESDFGGKQDWFLPSKDELNVVYQNLKKKGIGDFGDGWYWSSSQHDTYIAWCQDFSNGNQYGDYKHLTY